MSEKHLRKLHKRTKIKRIILFSTISICVILGILLYFKLSEAKYENKLPKKSKDSKSQVQEPSKEEVQLGNQDELSTLEIVDVEDMPKQIKGYNVIGEIEIPKINLKKYILEYFTMDSMDVSITRFWGNGINKAGNFSIIGHNYKGMFRDLKDLEIGDQFTLTSSNGETCNYVIYDIYIVDPEDVSCIEDSLNGKREVTLITCTVGGEKRLILKGKEQ